MLTLTLLTLGLPLEGVGLLLAIAPTLDIMRTAADVAGQVVSPLIVAARESILDRDAYTAATSFELTDSEESKVEKKPAFPAIV